MLQTSTVGLGLIRRFEGERLSAYRDIVGHPTIGFGHTGPDIYLGLTITSQESLRLLVEDVHKVDAAIQAFVHVPINQNQHDALASFAFNLGIAALRGSTLLKLLNAGNYHAAQSEFAIWNHAGGHVIEALTERRGAEAELFGQPV